MMNMKAIIFDMDGVLMDTRNVYIMAMQKLFEDEFGKSIPRKEVEALFGRIGREIIVHFLKKYGLKGDIEKLIRKKKKIVKELQQESLKIFPGAKTLLKSLSLKYKIALVSSTWRSLVINALDVFSIRKYFSLVVGKENVKKHKPDPAPYLFAASKLKVKPCECIVVEDSIAGVEAGKRAGMKVIAVATSYSKSKLSKADLIVDSIAEIKV